MKEIQDLIIQKPNAEWEKMADAANTEAQEFEKTIRGSEHWHIDSERKIFGKIAQIAREFSPLDPKSIFALRATARVAIDYWEDCKRDTKLAERLYHEVSRACWTVRHSIVQRLAQQSLSGEERSTAREIQEILTDILQMTDKINNLAKGPSFLRASTDTEKEQPDYP